MLRNFIGSNPAGKRTVAAPRLISMGGRIAPSGACLPGAFGLASRVAALMVTGSIAATAVEASASCRGNHFDRLTPSEKRYLRAMAQIGPGPHRSGDVALELGKKVTALGPTRNQLIAKGMIWSPNHGDTAFTVPLFDQFMRRIMPGEDWRTG